MPCLSATFNPTIGPLLSVLIAPAGTLTPKANGGGGPKVGACILLIDTGADITCLAPDVAAKLGLQLLGKRDVGHAAGSAKVNTYLADGLVLCAAATFCAFFAMTRYGHRTGETIERVGAVLRSDLNVQLGGQPTVDESLRTTQTPKEKRFGKIGALWERAAIILVTLSFSAFIAGAVIGGYMISGAPPTEPTQAPGGSLSGSTGGIVPPGGPEKNSD